MSIDLEEFNQEFFQEVMASADAAGRYAEDSFFEQFCEQLVDAGELETADRARYNPARPGIRIDGYGGDPSASGELSLIIADFNQAPDIKSLTQTDMDAIFNRSVNFLKKSLDADFRNSLEEEDHGFALADLIASRWSKISKVRIFLISNRQLSSRVDGREAGELFDRPITYSVWDIGRLHRYVVSGHGKEDIEIDLEKEFGSPIPVLPAHLTDAGYEAYLAVIPGEQLAAIYDRWGARLLEQNVRVFLQARGNVNKGIRNTLDNDPEMFFAYNNGITATAEDIEFDDESSGLQIRKFRNLQIVNGGQTTASIHAASRRKADLSKVFVQMKLSIVPAENSVEIVPKISEYANSQNRVNAADFFANHPFHIRMEEFSRRIYAPSPDGTFRESKWFYERARGQYQDNRGLLTPAQRKKVDLEYPKQQLLSKTDLAKYINVWLGHPDIVSRGAQKNFAYFAARIGKEWPKNTDKFNENFYRNSISKAIVFRRTEKLVSAQSWYEGGYRANIVAYAISKLAYDVEKKDKTVNFATIWRHQEISEPMSEALALAAKSAHDVLIDPPSGISNITEWAKKQACWERVKSQKILWSPDLQAELIGIDELKEENRSAVKNQKMLNGIEAQSLVVSAGANFWKELLAWGNGRKLLTPMENGILKTAASIPNKLPSEKQSLIAVEVLKKLHLEGCLLCEDLISKS